MMRRRRTKDLLTWLLGLACIALAWVIYEEIDDRSPSEVPGATDIAALPADQTAPPQTVFAMPDKDSLAVILERPIFSQTRRRSGGMADEQATSTDFTLSGVVISATQRFALVQPAAGGIIHRLKEGEDIGGWILVEIEPDRIILRRGTVEAEVLLDYDAPAPPLPYSENIKEKAAEPSGQQPANQSTSRDPVEAEPAGEPQN
jgi:type II secretory pathway component PulC